MKFKRIIFYFLLFMLIFHLGADDGDLVFIEEIPPVEESSDLHENDFLADNDYLFTEDEHFSEEQILLFEKLLQDEASITLEYIDSDEDYSILSDEDSFFSKNAVSLADDLFFSMEYEDDDYFFFEAPDLVIEAAQFELRSFYDLFASLSPYQRRAAMSSTGLRYSFEKGENPSLYPNPDSGINLINNVMQKNPSHIIEALFLVPYNERELDLLDIYNALGRIQNIKDQTLPARNGAMIAVFKETTRLDNAQRRRAISDPLPAQFLPFSETMYLRLTDAYVGNLFLKGDMSISRYGITYNMTNFRDISFTVIRVMKAERVSINIYIEPVKEGILIYSMSGLYLPEFIAKRMNLTSNINNRITVLINWITEGLQIQE